MTTVWYVRGKSFTCLVWTDSEDVIVKTAPILSRFRGQPLANLRRWWPVVEVLRLGEEG